MEYQITSWRLTKGTDGRDLYVSTSFDDPTAVRFTLCGGLIDVDSKFQAENISRALARAFTSGREAFKQEFHQFMSPAGGR